MLTPIRSWQLKTMHRRWAPAKSVHLDLGGGAAKLEVGPEMGFSKWPGQCLAELSIWIVVASMLHFSPALDNSRKPIDVRYALIEITNLTT